MRLQEKVQANVLSYSGRSMFYFHRPYKIRADDLLRLMSCTSCAINKKCWRDQVDLFAPRWSYEGLSSQLWINLRHDSGRKLCTYLIVTQQIDA